MFTRVTSASGGSDPKAKAFSTSTTRPPRHRGTKSSKTERSKLIEVEASTPVNSSAE